MPTRHTLLLRATQRGLLCASSDDRHLSDRLIAPSICRESLDKAVFSAPLSETVLDALGDRALSGRHASRGA